MHRKLILIGSLLTLFTLMPHAYADNACKNYLEAKQYAKAVEACQDLTRQNPGNWQDLKALGDSELGAGDYQEAINTYAKAIPMAKAHGSTEARDAASLVLTSQGNAYLKLHKNQEALARYKEAAPLSLHPGIAYFNSCAMSYNMGITKDALDYCDKAIKADPNKADAYFIIGSLLLADSKVNGGHVVAPPDTAKMLNKYLELSPNGPHAQDVKDMLNYIK